MTAEAGFMTVSLGRLQKRSEFLRVAKANRKFAAPGLVLQAARRDTANRRPLGQNGAAVRVGYTASRKVGGAVARNRAKRRLRAVAAQIVTAHARPDTDLVLIARAGTLTRPFPDLLSDLERALKKTNVWQDHEKPASDARD